MEHWLDILMNGLDPETPQAIGQDSELARLKDADERLARVTEILKKNGLDEH